MTDKHDKDLLSKISSLNVSNDDEKAIDTTSAKLYSEQFKKELDKTKFIIFRPIADCGYYGWKRTNETFQPISEQQSTDDIKRHVDIDGKPNKLLPLSQLKVPCSFLSLPPDKHPRMYPFAQNSIAAMYVASKHRNVDLNKIDFVFGGSTFEVLAKHDDSEPFLVCRIPTATANHTLLLVEKCMDYTQDFAALYYQFERYVTTGSMHYNDTNKSADHIQVMEIGGKFKVLLCAKADAIDEDNDPIKTKTSNWGTKTMFQLIGLGCPTACNGVKGRNNTLNHIAMLPLSDVVSEALHFRSCQTLERNIVDGMQAMVDQMKTINDYESYKITFGRNGELSLQRTITHNEIMLPPVDLVKELLELK